MASFTVTVLMTWRIISNSRTSLVAGRWIVSFNDSPGLPRSAWAASVRPIDSAIWSLILMMISPGMSPARAAGPSSRRVTMVTAPPLLEMEMPTPS